MARNDTASRHTKNDRDVRRRPLLDTPAAAEYLGVSVRYVRRLRAERRIPAVCMGRKGSLVLYDPNDLDAFVDQSKEAWS